MEIKILNFYGDQLVVVKTEDGIYTPAKPIAEFLDISWKTQHRKLMTDPVFAEGVALRAIPQIDPQPMVYIRSNLVPLWLIRISVSRVDPLIRDKLLRYQKEAGQVLAEAFMGMKQPTQEEPLTELQVLGKMISGMIQLEQKQLTQERKQLVIESKVEKIEKDIEFVKHFNIENFMTVKTFAIAHRYPLDLSTAQKIGMKCSREMRDRGIIPTKIPDPQYKEVGTYPIDLLESVFNEVYGNRTKTQ